MARSAKTMHAMPLIQYSHGQKVNWEMRPEKTAPMRKPVCRADKNVRYLGLQAYDAGEKSLPDGAASPKNENTISFLLPGAYVLPRMAKALGNNNAGPMPCIPRQKSNKMALGP